MRAVFVTGNAYKRREAAAILGVELEAASPDIPEEQAPDVAGVASRKALAAREALGFPPYPVIVEDSGIVFGAWNGLPGPFTKWFLASVGKEGLLGMLSPYEDRSARAVCAVAVATGNVGTVGAVAVFEGEVNGTIAPEPRGESGFGWDPIFVPDGGGLTYAQMGEAKNRDSHRARAFRQVRDWLEGLEGGRA